MEKEEILKQLSANFATLSKIENLKDTYKIIGYVFNLLQKLEESDKSLSEKLLVIASNIRNSADLGLFK